MEGAEIKSAPAYTVRQTKNEDENQKAPTVIYDIVDSCFDVFERLVSEADGALPLDTSPASSNEPSRNIRGLRNNFAFWIDYTGALAPVGASLDDRLKGHDEISEMVMELLEMVDRNLHRRQLTSSLPLSSI